MVSQNIVSSLRLSFQRSTSTWTTRSAVYATWLGGDGVAGEGISDAGLTALVTTEVAPNTSYNYHRQNKVTCDLNDLDICFTNIITAGGGMLPV